MIGLFSEV